MKVTRITTIDNPYDPFDQFEEWFAFDEGKGYHTSEYLARIAHPSYDLGKPNYHEEIESAIDEIIDVNPLKIYKKVVKEI